MVQSRALQAQADVKRKLPVAWDFVMDDIHPQSKTLTARIGFYKVGDMQFISHLDLQRFMKRAFVRSGLPIWFSEGFNPHPKMVFSTPLSIGIQSECEFADIKMTAPVTPAQVVDALNPCMPDTLQLFYAAPPVHKMTDIGYITHVTHLVSKMLEKLDEYIVCHTRTCMSQMRVAVYCRTADIKSHMPLIDRLENLFLSRKGVSYI